jgi:Transposase zinc-ribbon domain
MAHDKDDLWRNFPKTALEFERRFATEEACRAYWIEARWGGEPTCARCGSKRVWAERGGFLFECGDCDHQTSLTSGTLVPEGAAFLDFAGSRPDAGSGAPQGRSVDY